VTIEVKICGLCDKASVTAAIEGGARYLGFVFYPPSPRSIHPFNAAKLAADVPQGVTTVGLFVDPLDDDIDRVLSLTPLRMLQLHGGETPERVAAIQRRTRLPVMKAIGISSPSDLERIRLYEGIADLLLLDAVAGDTPGGNGEVFNWSLLKNVKWAKPWMLAGGLTQSNIAEAVRQTGARLLDVSSGVEEARGLKNPTKIKAFLDAAGHLET